MHRCLAVEDVVEEILQYAETSPAVVGTTRAPSFVFMQTCRSFYEPACNVRWSTLKSFAPLVRLFSQGAVGKGPTTLEVHSPEHWERFRYYAQRVRTLKCPWTWEAIAYLRTLIAFRPDETHPLLPGLRHMFYSECNKIDEPFLPIKLLAHPGLLAVTISFDRMVHGQPSLDFLETATPMLQRLEATVVPNILTAPKLHHLTTFKCTSGITSSILLRHLARLPGLRVLCATLAPEAATSLPETPRLFLALQVLQLTVTTPSDATTVCSVAGSKKISSFFVCSKFQPTGADIRTWVHLLSQQPLLRKVDIRITHSFDNEFGARWHPSISTEPTYRVIADDLHPLFTLPLIAIMILRDVPLSLGDDFLERVAISWPQLRVLVIGTGVRFHRTGLSLGGLRPLSACCPELRVLAATIDTKPPTGMEIAQEEAPEPPTPETQVEITPEVTPPQRLAGLRRVTSFLRNRLPLRRRQASLNLTSVSEPASAVEDVGDFTTGDIACPQLRQLDIGNSTIHSPKYVASFLSEHFPNVRLVSDVCFFTTLVPGLEKINQTLQKRSSRRWAALDAAAADSSCDLHMLQSRGKWVDPLFKTLFESVSINVE